MTPPGTRAGADANGAGYREQREWLASRLPGPVRRAIAWLLRPECRWLRLPAGIALILGGFFGFLPVLGFWMVPLGALLLAEDIPVLRKPTTRAIAAVQRWLDRRRTGG